LDWAAVGLLSASNSSLSRLEFCCCETYGSVSLADRVNDGDVTAVVKVVIVGAASTAFPSELADVTFVVATAATTRTESAVRVIDGSGVVLKR